MTNYIQCQTQKQHKRQTLAKREKTKNKNNQKNGKNTIAKQFFLCFATINTQYINENKQKKETNQNAGQSVL